MKILPLFIVVLLLLLNSRALAEVKCEDALKGLEEKTPFEIAEFWAKRLGDIESSVKTIQKKQRNLDDHYTVNEIRGLPRGARWINPGETIFRHYTAEPEIKKQIIESLSLRNGNAVYESISPRVYRDIYSDLSGIFLTLPSRSADLVGRAGNHLFVDVTLLPNTPLLEIEKGHIYLIPLPRQYPDWIVALYQKFESGQTLPPSELELCEKIRSTGGIFRPIFFPVKIQESR